MDFSNLVNFGFSIAVDHRKSNDSVGHSQCAQPISNNRFSPVFIQKTGGKKPVVRITGYSKQPVSILIKTGVLCANTATRNCRYIE
uniref:Uncharacterized protein n=1 Tax=Caenorhabditis japonica TaxID=281687 RepID=A0A8R1E683_CAEJA